MIPEIDFETFSAAGLKWNGKKDTAPQGIAPGSKGLFCTGAWEYAAHPSTEVMCLYIRWADGVMRDRWIPGEPLPQKLFDHIAAGGLVEAHNSFFEYVIWRHVCAGRMGWPELPLEQLRCSQSKAGAYGLPLALEKGLKALRAPIAKDMKGNAVMKRLTTPHTPAKIKPWHRHHP